MLSPLVAIGFAAVADAIAIRSGCSFHISVAGAMAGPAGEISSGQVRAGKGLSATSFTMNGDTISDPHGKGCWWTPPTHTLQCDQGQAPDKGFSIGCDGTVSYKGQTTFYECQTETSGQDNIYLMPSGTGCSKVTLKADGCHASCAPPPPPPSSTCPTDLSGPYEFPHLIVPISKAHPSTAYGTSYNGEWTTGDIASIFNFDIPAADKGKKCSLVFLFPKQQDLSTSSYTFSGDGYLNIDWLNSPASKTTTYNNQPSVKKDLGHITIAPGHGYQIATFDCPYGQTIAFEVKSAGTSSLKYFQDYNPSPIGLYITKC